MTTPPKSPPPNLSIRARPKPVTRLNRWTLIALAGVSAAAVLSAMVWALQGRDRGKPTGDELYNTDRVNPAEGLQTLPRDYSQVQPPQLGAPLPGELGGPIVRTERETGIPQMPERSNFRPDPEEDARRAAMLRAQQEAEAAAKAAVFFQSIRPRQEAAAATTAPPEPNGSALTAIPTLGTETANAPVDAVTTQNMQDRKQSFLNRETDQKIYGSGTLQTPRSPYQVMAGTIIPAALVTGINSDLPGQIIGNVTENVYDTVSGRHLLIPQGARLIGQYDSGVAFGQSRVLLVWNRIVMPDGSSIVLDRLSGVDTAGYAGLEDEVDNHWGRLIGGAVLSSLLGIGAELAAPENRSSSSGDRIIVATRSGAQETINDVGQQITRRNLNIQPTLTVRPGFPVRVIVNKDLVLRPYQAAPLTANIRRDD